VLLVTLKLEPPKYLELGSRLVLGSSRNAKFDFVTVAPHLDLEKDLNSEVLSGFASH